MGLDISALTDVLKEDYLPPLQDLLNNDIKLMDYIEDGEQYIEGRHAYVPLHVSRNEGIGARAENATLPTAGNEGYDSATYGAKYIYGRIQVSGPAAAVSRSDQGSFVRAMNSEIEGMSKNMKHEVNRMYWNDGSGILAQCAASTTTTLNLVTSGVNTTNIRNLRVGMKIDILNMTSGVTADGGGDSNTINAVGTTTITLASAVTTTTTVHAVYREDSRNKEPYGLRGIINNVNPDANWVPSGSNGVTDLGGIDRDAVDAWWDATVLDNSGTNRALTLELLQQLLDNREVNSNGNDALCIFTTYAIRRKYAALVTPDRRYNINNEGKNRGYDGGWGELFYDDIPFMVDKFATPNNLYLIGEGGLVIFKMVDWEWMDKDGAILSRVSNTDAYEATLLTYRQLGSRAPNANGRIKDLLET